MLLVEEILISSYVTGISELMLLAIFNHFRSFILGCRKDPF